MRDMHIKGESMRTTAIAAVAACLMALGGCAAMIPAMHAGAAAVAAHAAAAPIAAGAAAAGASVGIGVLISDDVKRAIQAAKEMQIGPQDPGTFGAFLADSHSGVQNLVQKAMQSQREVLVVAGVQVRAAIAKAAAAYRPSLKTKTDALGEPEKKFMAEMESVLADLNSGADASQKAAGDRAQAMADKLRLATDAPQLKTIGPIFLFSSLPTQSIKLRGNFPPSYARTSIPELLVNGKSYKAYDFQADTLTFLIRTAELDAAESQDIAWRSAELVVPWDRPVFNIATAGERAIFGIELGVLPHSFGRMVMEHKITRLRQEEKARYSEDFLLDSSSQDVEETRCLALTPQELSDGWKIRPGSAAFVLHTRIAGEQNVDWKDLGIQSESEHSTCWRARTIHGGGSPTTDSVGGKIVWRIAAKIRRDVNEPSIASQGVDLAWGSRHVFNHAAGTWKLRYSRNGSSFTEAESADLSNPFIRINSDGAGVMVSIYPF
jgi:hypothetical protein